MDNTVALLICIFVALLLQAMYRAYYSLPERELKRRASHAHSIYKRILVVTSFGVTGQVFFKILIWFFTVSSVILIVRQLSTLDAFMAIGILALALRWAALKNISYVSRFAAFVAPPIAVILEKIEPSRGIIQNIIKFSPKTEQSNEIYDKEDLKSLLLQQKGLPHNQIDETDIDNALHALEIRNNQIKNYMIERDKIHFVTPKDPIGPILMSELHKSGFSCFPVQGNSVNEVVGMLYMNDLADYTSGGTVANAMNPEVYYVREDQKLDQVLQAFTYTSCYIFMVLNKQQELVGLISVSDVLEQLLGKSIYSEFMDYDNPASVARHKPEADVE